MPTSANLTLIFFRGISSRELLFEKVYLIKFVVELSFLHFSIPPFFALDIKENMLIAFSSLMA